MKGLLHKWTNIMSQRHPEVCKAMILKQMWQKWTKTSIVGQVFTLHLCVMVKIAEFPIWGSECLMKSGDLLNPTPGSLRRSSMQPNHSMGKKFCYLGVLLPSRASQNHTQTTNGFRVAPDPETQQARSNTSAPHLALNLNLFKEKPTTWEGLGFFESTLLEHILKMTGG